MKQVFISVAQSGCLEGSISMSSLQLHFLQTLEHRTDVSVTSTSPRWGAPEEHGLAQVPPPLCSTRGHPRPLLPSCPHLPMAVSWVGWGWTAIVGGVLAALGASLVQMYAQGEGSPPCSPLPLPACSAPAGVGNLWISETITELCPGEAQPDCSNPLRSHG